TDRTEPVPTNLGQRQKTTADVLTRCTGLTELEDGYQLEYPRTETWEQTLDAFQATWRKSCPQMTFERADEQGEGTLVLQIRGPDGTKQFVEGARYMLTSHINPAPTLKHKFQQAYRLASSPLRTLPDFLIIGAKKCGTTALYSYLTQHPSIAPALKKEIYFFNAFHGRGKLWYRSHFPTVLTKWQAKRSSGRPLLTGEATPDYLFHPHCARLIHEDVPKAKLIVILRNPVDRAYSFYNHNLRAGLETLSFDEAVDSEEARLAEEAKKVDAQPDYFSFDYMHHSYLRRGIYVDQLKSWNEFFPKEQMLVLQTEALYERPKELLERAFEFLDLPYHEPGAFKKLNAAPPYPDMDPSAREKLSRYFEPHNRRLYEYIGTDMGW
ncbi:MAG: sulfotransferase domain-containing protein, partial [Planctomycetota bacterium]